MTKGGEVVVVKSIYIIIFHAVGVNKSYLQKKKKGQKQDFQKKKET